MKKFIIVCLLLFPLAAYAGNSFMDKCVKSWIGYSLDSVTKSWGFPEYEKNIAGKKLYVWETYDYDSEIIEGSGMTISSKDSRGNETSFTMGGKVKVEYCKKIVEVDSNNIVTDAHWEGNDCPRFYVVGKKFVNPANDEWAKKKAR